MWITRCGAGRACGRRLRRATCTKPARRCNVVRHRLIAAGETDTVDGADALAYQSRRELAATSRRSRIH